MKDLNFQIIVIISLDKNDFKNWVIKNDIIYPTESLDFRNSFICGNKQYVCISNIDDANSLPVDKIICTESAINNSYYNELLYVLKASLNP